MSEAVCTDVRNRLHNVGAVRRGRRGWVSELGRYVEAPQPYLYEETDSLAVFLAGEISG